MEEVDLSFPEQRGAVYGMLILGMNVRHPEIVFLTSI